MAVVHLVARLRAPRRDLGAFEPARWLWERIEALFPKLIASAIMPNHAHVLSEVAHPAEARGRLAKTCGHLQRNLGVEDLFEPLPPAEIVEPSKVPRVARYIELNASRGGLVLHPAEWLWTTLRDVAGAVVWPAVDLRHQARRTKSRRRGAWLDYVVRDDRVQDRRALGDPVPGLRQLPAFGLETIATAVVAATRCPPSVIRTRGPIRELFVTTAIDQGISSTSLLATACGCTPRAIQIARQRPAPESQLLPIRRCLADARLLRPAAALVRPLFATLEGG